MAQQRRRPIYSRSTKPRAAQTGRQDFIGSAPIALGELPTFDDGPTLRQRLGAAWARIYGRHSGKILVVSSVLMTLLVLGVVNLFNPAARPITQTRLDAAVAYALDNRPRPPSTTAIAAAIVRPSVVLVSGRGEFKITDEEEDTTEPETEQQAEAEEPQAEIPGEGGRPDFHRDFETVGTGVVIDEMGTILTNLHVAIAAKDLRVTFADGTEANAKIVAAQAENDLAVIQPDTIPDDLQPAVLTTSQGLHHGDQVVAVGFPFGIGPSTSAGVVSGLKRSFKRGDEDVIKNLIQFDAAANPGNSGGPLINMDGEVVGIVTAILNPSGVRTFAGIGFAVPIETAAGAAGESPL